MRIPIQIELYATSRRDLKFFLSKLVEINMRKFRTLNLPPLYRSGVRYRREIEDYGTRQPLENWQAVDKLYESGFGDCEDLAAALCAERRLQGYDARIRLTSKGRIFHVTVKVGNTIEDPSKVLGMKGEA